jgi:membrane-bound lytic murein transglycosylase
MSYCSGGELEMTNCNYSEHTKIQRKEIQKQIEELQEKLQKLEEIEKQPRMNLQQEGEYAVVSYHDKVYYRLEGEVTFSWYIKKGVSANYRVPTLVMVEDAETERLLEGIYYNHIQVKKEKEQRTKTPVEECYKDWWGQYPETGTWDSFDDKRWQGFQAGYEFAYAISTAKEVMEKVQEEQKWDAVHESVEWCEENPDKDPLDWLKPQTPEQTAQSLKEAFIKAQQTENWKETQKLIDEEDNDKNFKNSLDLIKEWGEKNKPPTLKELLWEWWEDIFTVDADLDADASIDVLVDRIDKEFIPPSHDTNSYKWNECIRTIREKLR